MVLTTLYRYIEVSQALFNPNLVLFRRCEGEMKGVYDIDSRSNVNDMHLAYFTFFGRFLAKAVMDSQV